MPARAHTLTREHDSANSLEENKIDAFDAVIDL